MAFTLDTKYLIAHLRQSFEVHEENEHIKKIIKPINAEDLIENEGTNISIIRQIDRKNQGVYSPPIGFDSETYMEAGLKSVPKESKNEEKVSEEKAYTGNEEESTVFSTQEELNSQVDRQRRQKAIRSSRLQRDDKRVTSSENRKQKKSKIKRFFQGGKREIHPPSDSEDSSSRSQRLEFVRKETKRRGTDDDSTISTDKSSLDAIEVPSIENSDLLTIDEGGILDSVSNLTYTESNVSDRLYLGVKGTYDSSDTLHQQQEPRFNEGDESNGNMSWFGEQEYEEMMNGNNNRATGENEYDKTRGTRGDKHEAETNGEREEGDDDDDEDEDVSTSILASTDSAFTDIDSTVGSSILLDDSYSQYSDFNLDDIDLSELKAIEQLSHERKGRMDFDFQETNNDAWRKNAHQNAERSTGSTLNPRNKQTKKPTLQFDKVKTESTRDVKEKVKISNLSRLIQSKHDSLDSNPLNYYSFVASEAEKTSCHQFNIFLPPESYLVFPNLELPDYVAIADCIGYILLRLSQAGHILLTDVNVLDPNCWRLELVDEDGENYGSFGVLDRGKCLSSYNNPSEIAICKINEKNEVMQNEKQTPLPFKLRQNIQSYRNNCEQQQLSSKNVEETTQLSKSDNDSVVEIIISDFTKTTWDEGLPQNHVSFLFSKKARVGDLLKEYCLQSGLSPSKYKIRVANVPEDHGSGITFLGNKDNLRANSTGADSLATIPAKKELNAEESVGNLKHNHLDIVPLEGVKDSNSNVESFKEGVGESYGITPSYALSTIAPQIKHQERQDIKKESKQDTEPRKERPHLDKIEEAVSTKSNLPSELSMNMLKGDDSIFPVNINTIYFQWSVWRRKPTLLNKFERSLIVDGDYIHLAPSEVTSYKKSTTDNPFYGSHLHHHHHHHHLHHYNYANYYNSLLMKTASFHITQIIKLKQYRISKNPSHFKIVIDKASDVSTNAKESNVRKKYDLEAVNAQECEDILNKIKWVQDVYRKFNSN